MTSLIILSPLIGFALISLFLFRWKKLCGWISVGSLLIPFVLIVQLFMQMQSNPSSFPQVISVPWISIMGLHFELGLLFDQLSILMGLLVSGVGSLIFIFSMGYMEEDKGYSRFFAYLALFASAMLGIVFSNNFVQTFIFWELVGLASYLLIGFWFSKDSAADASKKAFLVNRVGDFGFILGILFLWFLSDPTGVSRTVDFAGLAQSIPTQVQLGVISSGAILLAGLLILCGVIGKSAQLPLHVWLPDAMEGPTPVSALIHAATMVAAGVYLLARTFFIFTISEELLTIVAIIGGLSAITAATMAVCQSDIKRVLAFSTMSQLGFMVLAMGLAGPVSGMYHLLTHGFFKALLFLGSGCIIHAVHTQNLFEMGGLSKKMPITTLTFLIGTLALCGLFPTSGFFSKEEILTLAHGHSMLAFIVVLGTTFLTSFYMGRVFSLTFLGPQRKPSDIHESPFILLFPLIVLSFFSIFAGFFGIPELLGRAAHESHHGTEGNFLALISTGVILFGLISSYLIYGRKTQSQDPLSKGLGPLYTLFERKYFIDEIYNFYVSKIQQPFARLCDITNEWIAIKALSHWTGIVVYQVGNVSRKLLTGNVQTYALILAVQIVVIFTLVVILFKL